MKLLLSILNFAGYLGKLASSHFDLISVTNRDLAHVYFEHTIATVLAIDLRMRCLFSAATVSVNGLATTAASCYQIIAKIARKSKSSA